MGKPKTGIFTLADAGGNKFTARYVEGDAGAVTVQA